MPEMRGHQRLSAKAMTHLSPWRPWVDIPVFIGLALLCAGISNHFAGPTRRLTWVPAASTSGTSSPASALPEPSPELLARFPPLPDRPESDLDGEDVLWLHSHGALFLDARRTLAFTQGHIAGASSVSVWENGLDAKVDQLAALAPNLQAPVVIYCSGSGCTDSHALAQKLWLAGFRNLRIYSGGFPEWEARGWPITKGEQP